MSTRLYIIATPIGNLSDLSDRTKKVLEDVDLIFAEDTRVSGKLLHYLGLKVDMVSCHKFNEKSRIKDLEDAFANNQTVALMSDAGTPLLSDPGQRVVQKAIDLGFEICAIPGPTALIQALVGSGLSCERFSFEGFLPEKKGALKKYLQSIKNDSKTIVCYLSPHGLIERLELIAEVLGNRQACLAKELTKVHETYFRAPLLELKEHLNDENLRGEFTLVVAGRSESDQEAFDEKTFEQFVLDHNSEGYSVNEIARLCQKTFSIKKSDAYAQVLKIVGKR